MYKPEWIVVVEEPEGGLYVYGFFNQYRDAVRYAALLQKPAFVRLFMRHPLTGKEYESPYTYDRSAKFTNKAYNKCYGRNGRHGIQS